MSLERAGARFYRAMAERVGGAKLRELLLFLAEAEDAHVEFWEGIESDRWAHTAEQPFEDVGALLALLHGPDEVEELAAAADGEDAVFEIAIRAEEDSIRLYRAMRDRATDPRLAEDLAGIVREEERHRHELVQLRQLARLSDPETLTDRGEIDRGLRAAVEEDERRRDG